MLGLGSGISIQHVARKLAEGLDARDPSAQREDIVTLIQLFAEKHDADTLLALKSEYPDLASALERIPEAALVRNRGDRSALSGIADQVAGDLNRRVGEMQWAALGLSTIYEAGARKLCTKPGYQFIRDVAGAPRFFMEADAYRSLLPETKGILGRFRDRMGMKEPIERRLDALRVPKAEIDVGVQRRLIALETYVDDVHLPPRDAALLFDAVALADRGLQLHADPAWTLVRRAQIPGKDGDENCFAMPVSAFRSMRGIAYELDEHAPDEEVRVRCETRLKERGVDSPTVALTDLDGQKAIMLSADEARVLLAPVAAGDPATQLTMKRIDYFPDAAGYHGENGVFLVQAAQLAYENEETVKAYTKAWGFDDCTFVANAQTDAQAFIAKDVDRNTIVVSFRGSATLHNFITDADARLVDGARYGGGRVHEGFAWELDSIRQAVDAAVQKYTTELGTTPKIMLAGHSLGGALAGLYAADCAKRGIKVGTIYTCGQPKIGDTAAINAMGNLLRAQGTRFFRYINNNDIVPRIPPNCDHGQLGVAVYIDRFGRIQKPNGAPPPDRSGWLTAIVDGAGLADHHCPFYLAFVRKGRDVAFEL
jgi:hypothetical protein